MRQVVTLALNTGMRKGEILHLKWEGVNLRERFIEITEQKNGERSTIPLNSTAVDILRAIPAPAGLRLRLYGVLTPGEPF